MQHHSGKDDYEVHQKHLVSNQGAFKPFSFTKTGFIYCYRVH